MMIIIVALALLLVAALAVAVFLFLKTRHFKADNMQLRAVVENQENYIFLINRLFEVKETNVKAPEGQPMLLGNVLHCRNAEETGHCGEGSACKHCPVRFVLNKSFERQADFRNLEACMELTGSDRNTVDVDVSVNGAYVSIESKPHMVVNVQQVNDVEGSARPKILFVSKDASLYDRVREALGITYRVLSADSEHHALHRLLRAADYNFCAVMTDSQFYGASNAVTALLEERKSQLPLFVFVKEGEPKPETDIHYVNTDFAPKDLLKRVVAVAG